MSASNIMLSAAIAEVRNTINTERNRRGKGTYSFANSVSVGAHITDESLAEIRTAAAGIKTNGSYVPPVPPSGAINAVPDFLNTLKSDLNNLNDESPSVVYKQEPVEGWIYDDWMYSRGSGQPTFFIKRYYDRGKHYWDGYWNSHLVFEHRDESDFVKDGYKTFYKREPSFNSRILFQRATDISEEENVGGGVYVQYYKIRRVTWGVVGYNTVVDYYYWP